MKRMGLSVFALLLGLSACSGGGVDLAEGGIGGTGFSMGPISAFGSIYVNGVEYATDNAQVTLDGEPASVDQLRLGLMVTVQGTRDADGVTGTAETIQITAELRGPLETVASPQGPLRVAGQSARVDERTVFAGVEDLSALTPGDWLRVSGLAQGDGEWLATRVEREARDPAREIRLRGVIEALDAATLRFQLNQLSVRYDQATQLPASLSNGQWIEVFGALVDGVLHASRLRQAPSARPPADAPLDLRGYLTRYVNETDFDLAFRPARIHENTQFVFGTREDLRAGVELTARGTVDANGALVLDRVEFNGETSGRGAPGEVLVAAPLETVDAANRRLTVFGIPVEVPRTTVFDNVEASRGRFDGLIVGEWLTVHGFINPENGVLVAERVGQKAASAALQGRVEHVDDAVRSLTLLGVPVVTDGQTQYFDARNDPPPLPAPGQPPRPRSDNAINAAEFFAQVPDNSVNATGQTLGNALLAERLVLLPRVSAQPPR